MEVKREIALRSSWRVWAIIGRCAQCLVSIGELAREYISRMRRKVGTYGRCRVKG